MPERRMYGVEDSSRAELFVVPSISRHWLMWIKGMTAGQAAVVLLT